MTSTDDATDSTVLALGQEERMRIDRCIAWAMAHPRSLGDVFDDNHRMSFGGGVRTLFSVNAMGGGKGARHLSVSMQDPKTGRPVVPDPGVVGTLVRAFGFEDVTLGTTGENPFVLHAVEVVELAPAARQSPTH